MAEYIEREAVNKLLKAACDECRETCEEFDGFYADCNQCIMHSVVKGVPAIPAADVRPVVRGKWIVSRTDYGWNSAEFPTHCKCEKCGREIPYNDKDNFCPNCGADMREVEHD